MEPDFCARLRLKTHGQSKTNSEAGVATLLRLKDKDYLPNLRSDIGRSNFREYFCSEPARYFKHGINTDATKVLKFYLILKSAFSYFRLDNFVKYLSDKYLQKKQ